MLSKHDQSIQPAINLNASPSIQASGQFRRGMAHRDVLRSLRLAKTFDFLGGLAAIKGWVLIWLMLA